jgi:hypothetical protein
VKDSAARVEITAFHDAKVFSIAFSTIGIYVTLQTTVIPDRMQFASAVSH